MIDEDDPRLTDRLAGNPEALACRERYRDIVRALGDETGKCALRLETRLNGDGTCTMICTHSMGAEADMNVCRLALAMFVTLAGIKPREPEATPRRQQAGGDVSCPDCNPDAFWKELEERYGPPVRNAAGVRIYSCTSLPHNVIYDPAAHARFLCPRHGHASPAHGKPEGGT